MATSAIEVTSGAAHEAYFLTQDEITSTTNDYLRELGSPSGRFIGTVVGPDSPMFAVGRTIEAEVFGDAFPSNDQGYMRESYEPLDEASHFMLVVDQKGSEGARPVAFMRLVRPEDSSGSTKSIDDAAANIGSTTQDILDFHGIDQLSQTIDIATLGLLKEYRDTTASIKIRTILNRMFILHATQQRAEHMVAVIDEGALKGLRAVGIPVRPMLAEDDDFAKISPFEFDGSKASYAIHGDIPTFWGAVGIRRRELKRESRYGRDIFANLLSLKGLSRAIRRRWYARVATQLLTGASVDQYIQPPIAL